MVAFLVCCVALAISAMYELIEWWAALAMGQGADDFLGTQGDQWDTQSDMFCALLGALTTVIFLARFHCRQLRRFGGNDSNLLIVFYVQIMPDDFVMQLHRF